MNRIRTRASEDITGKIGPLYTAPYEAEWPMYSFNRPSYAFYQGIAEGLAQLGRKEPEIRDILQSKHMRWLFDGLASESVETLGLTIALKHGKDWKL